MKIRNIINHVDSYSSDKNSKILIISILLILISLFFGIAMNYHSNMDNNPSYEFTETRETLKTIFLSGMFLYPASLVALVGFAIISIKNKLIILSTALVLSIFINIYFASKLFPIFVLLFALMNVKM